MHRVVCYVSDWTLSLPESYLWQAARTECTMAASFGSASHSQDRPILVEVLPTASPGRPFGRCPDWQLILTGQHPASGLRAGRE